MTSRDPIDRLKRFQALNSFELPIDVSRIYLYESSPEPWGLKDLNSRYIYVNKAYHDLLNLPDNSDVTGKTFEDIMGRSEFSDHVRMNELLVIERREPIYSREVKRFGRDRELKPYIFKRMPYFSSSGEIIALEFNGMPWHKLALLNPNNAHLQIIDPRNIFTETEWERLYPYCSGFSKKHVAKMLKISESAVKQSIQSCKAKLKLDGSDEIIPHVISQGWMNYIPESFLKLHKEYIVLPSSYHKF